MDKGSQIAIDRSAHLAVGGQRLDDEVEASRPDVRPPPTVAMLTWNVER